MVHTKNYLLFLDQKKTEICFNSFSPKDHVHADCGVRAGSSPKPSDGAQHLCSGHHHFRRLHFLHVNRKKKILALINLLILIVLINHDNIMQRLEIS